MLSFFNPQNVLAFFTDMKKINWLDHWNKTNSKFTLQNIKSSKLYFRLNFDTFLIEGKLPEAALRVFSPVGWGLGKVLLPLFFQTLAFFTAFCFSFDFPAASNLGIWPPAFCCFGPAFGRFVSFFITLSSSFPRSTRFSCSFFIKSSLAMLAETLVFRRAGMEVFLLALERASVRGFTGPGK